MQIFFPLHETMPVTMTVTATAFYVAWSKPSDLSFVFRLSIHVKTLKHTHYFHVDQIFCQIRQQYGWATVADSGGIIWNAEHSIFGRHGYFC